MRFIAAVLVISVGLWAATILPGVDVDTTSPAGTAATLVPVAALFVAVNAALKPYLRVVAYPLHNLTHGLSALVVNALLFWLTSWLASLLRPFHVNGFWPALWGALVIAVVTLNIDRLLRT